MLSAGCERCMKAPALPVPEEPRSCPRCTVQQTAGSGPAAPDCFSLQLPWKPPGRRFYFPGAAVPSAACQVGRWMVGLRGGQERTAHPQIQTCQTAPEPPASGHPARTALLRPRKGIISHSCPRTLKYGHAGSLESCSDVSLRSL